MSDRTKNILVLCGGRSAERDVSCVSAAAILRNLAPSYLPRLVHIDSHGAWRYQKDSARFARSVRPERYPFKRTPARLEFGRRPALIAGKKRMAVDVVFPALHGPFGEDGTLQGLLEFAGLPYVGAGVLGSSLNMDKAATKRLAQAAGLPQLPYAVVSSPNRLGGTRRLKLPFFVKPTRLGSSVGVSKVKRRVDLARAVRKALRFDTAVVVEQGIEAREIECAVLGATEAPKVSVPGEIRPRAEFYSYEAKYVDPEGAELIVPARLSERQRTEVRELAAHAFTSLECYGLARVDFLMDRRTGKIWFNEANTLPGFTSISMYPKLWEASGLPFTRLLDRLIDLALRRHRRRSRLKTTR